MRKKIAAAALIGGLGLTGGLLVAPGLASAAGTDGGTGASSRVAAIKDALKGLVADETITQAQADKVATALEERRKERRAERGGPGGPGLRRQLLGAEAAAVIGITPQELRTQLRAGKSLAQIAEANRVTRSALIDGLLAAAEKRLSTAVQNGRITQAEADSKRAALRSHLEAKVDKPFPGKAGKGWAGNKRAQRDGSA